MAFQHSKRYIKQCDELSKKFIQLGVTFQELSKSIEQHGLDKDTKCFLEKQIKKIREIEKVE